jgi:hypothetical protein
MWKKQEMNTTSCFSEILWKEAAWESLVLTFSRQSAHGSEVVILTCWLLFTPQEYSWYSFLLEAELTPRP